MKITNIFEKKHGNPQKADHKTKKTGKSQQAYKPGSVRPGIAPGRGDHSSCADVAIRLMQPTRTPAPEMAATVSRHTVSLFGLAPGGVCHAADVAARAVGFYPAVSPVPVTYRWFVFCGTFPGVAPAGR